MAFYTANNQFACKVFSSGYRVLKNISQLAVVGRLLFIKGREVTLSILISLFVAHHRKKMFKVPEEVDRRLYLPPDKQAGLDNNSLETSTLSSCLMYVEPSDHSLGTTACKVKNYGD